LVETDTHNPDLGSSVPPGETMAEIPRPLPNIDPIAPAPAGPPPAMAPQQAVVPPPTVPSSVAMPAFQNPVGDPGRPGPPEVATGLGPIDAAGEFRPGPVRNRRWVVEWLAVLVVALLLAVGVRAYVAQMFYIPSGSMLPTLQVGDRIVVNKLSYRLHGVGRGDVVVFRRPPLESADYSDLVKRVIGLPGDTVAAIDGKVYVDGKPLAEPWLPQPAPVTSPSPLPEGFSLNHPFVVPAGEYYVMGDNRTDSEDSRYFGPISKDLIVGKMSFVAWPLSDNTWLVVLSVVAVVVLVLLVLALREPRPARAPPASEGSW
jgi:signal peptidase I